MNISYEKVFNRYFGLIDDVKELSLEESDLIELLSERLHSAVSDPFIRRLFSTLKFDDEIQQFEFELTTSVDEDSDTEFVIELFSKGMAIKWLEPKVKSLLNTSKFFGGKEEKKNEGRLFTK